MKPVDSAKCTIVARLDALVADNIKFGTIYLDPPWPYRNQGTRAATKNHYSTMTMGDIEALPIPDLAAEESHIHLWTTNGFLEESLRLLDVWGFDYQDMLVWGKGEVVDGQLKKQLGLGNYWRGSHEMLLLGVRGGLEFLQTGIPSFFLAKRGKHSAKPDGIRALIEQVSPGPRIELFSRHTSAGWHVWGNQIDGNLFVASVAYGGQS